jgi:hypothetical protein
MKLQPTPAPQSSTSETFEIPLKIFGHARPSQSNFWVCASFSQTFFMPQKQEEMPKNI